MPPELAPPAPSAPVGKKDDDVDGSWCAIVEHWRVVVADLALHYRIDLYDPAVLDRPWPGIRTMIFALIDQRDTRLRRALTRR